jgi:hypothetical protein
MNQSPRDGLARQLISQLKQRDMRGRAGRGGAQKGENNVWDISLSLNALNSSSSGCRLGREEWVTESVRSIRWLGDGVRVLLAYCSLRCLSSGPARGPKKSVLQCPKRAVTICRKVVYDDRHHVDVTFLAVLVYCRMISWNLDVAQNLVEKKQTRYIKDGIQQRSNWSR